ncbi:unnamed protein product [Dibothriocephalus latus]|uniref:Uncharacterized protein n=1 Tax=Dibothriocephalus latus TaxID=60516 RepID=A0A3P7LXQ6_DIBLA|nr:unnamed protein product [Dibothriocephalus latus]
MLADLPAIRNEEQEPMLQVILPKIFPKEGYHEPTVYNFLLAPQYKKAPVIWNESKARRMHYWLTGVFHPEDTDPQKLPASTGICDIIQKGNSPAVWSLSEQEGGGVKNQIDPDIHRQISDLLQSVMVGWISVDCRHSETGITPLMLFAAAGHLDLVERLLSLGADVFIRVALPRAALPPTIVTIGTVDALSGQVISHKNSEPMVGANAYDLARLYGHAEIASLLKAQMQVFT